MLAAMTLENLMSYLYTIHVGDLSNITKMCGDF
jgi:hypothetical protein